MLVRGNVLRGRVSLELKHMLLWIASTRSLELRLTDCSQDQGTMTTLSRLYDAAVLLRVLSEYALVYHLVTIV